MVTWLKAELGIVNKHCGDCSFKTDHIYMYYFRMNCHLSKLISIWIWIFSSTGLSILDEFLAIIASWSSWFLVAIPFNFQTQKLIQKWAAKMYQLKNAFNDFAVSLCEFQKKELHWTDQYFNGNSWSLDLWHLKFILFIDSFPISPVYQPASHAN